jgi:hypothetical protein
MSVSITPVISVFTIPIVILLVGILLSVKYFAYRKPIGVGLITIGILEILPFFIFYLVLNDLSHGIPFTPLSIIFIEGCITLVVGVVILFFTKPKNKETK